MLGTASKLATARNIKIQGAVSGNANFDGSQNVTIETTQENIVILKGKVSVPASNTQGQYNADADANVNYPKGFTLSNTKIIGIATSLPAKGDYTSGNAGKFSTINMQRGYFPCTVTKQKEGLIVTIYNGTNQAVVVDYEITLLMI